MNDDTAGTPDESQLFSEREARHGAAHALGSLHLNIAFQAVGFDAESACEVIATSSIPNEHNTARIALLGPCADLLADIEEDNDPSVVFNSLFSWADDVENGGGYSEDLLATHGRVESEIAWALAFVDSNYDLITEVASSIVSHGGTMTFEACTALVGGRSEEPGTLALEEANLRLAGALTMLERVEAALSLAN